MINLNFRWYNGLIIIVIIGLLHYFFINSKSNEIVKYETKLDTLRIVKDSFITKYKDRVVTDNKIVYKWSERTDSFIYKDTLYLEAKNDIQYLGQSINDCDSALKSSEDYSKILEEYNNALKSIKQPLFIPYVGVGISINSTVFPSFQLGAGVNINELVNRFKK